MKRLYAYILAAAAAVLVAGSIAARPRSLGGVFSFNGAEISFQQMMTDSTFFEINAGIDFCGVLDGQVSHPGVKAAFSYNFMFLRQDFSTGCLAALAGVGFTAGYVRQNGMSPGPMAGLTGKIGVEYRFHVPVILSLDFTPVLGMHLEGHGNYSRLKLYQEGLIKAYYPRLGIRYVF